MKFIGEQMQNIYLKWTKNILFIVIAALSLSLLLLPEIDLNITKFVYNNEQGFYLADNVFFIFLYNIIPIMTYVVCIICILGIILKFINTKSIRSALTSSYSFLLTCAILGPGLIVNSLFKNNFGRPRPLQIADFGGSSYYVPPFAISDQCLTNCSFTSGHAAMAFYFTALAYITPVSNHQKNIVYIIGIFFGFLIGFARIVQGGHFFSDVYFSCLIILIINHYVNKLYIYNIQLSV